MAQDPENHGRLSTSPLGGHNNNFGVLRLLFATFVIVAHSSELVDGNRTRELLTQWFGTISFGDLGVDGFFLVSGYLVTKSYLSNREFDSYLLKRIFRIVPGYLVNFWLCVLLLAPLVGGGSTGFSMRAIAQQLVNSLMLLQPHVHGSFASLRYPLLNGSMWTIAYEFLLYLATALFGLLGLYKTRYRPIVVALTVLAVLLHGYGYTHVMEIGGAAFGADSPQTRLVAFYLVGSLFYLFSGSIRLTHSGAIISAALLLTLIFSEPFAELAVLIFGGYLIFWFALRVPALPIAQILHADISYGLYLYAWPIQSLIIWSHPNINPWVLGGLSIVLAASCGYLSWTIIEKPALTFQYSDRFLMIRGKLAKFFNVAGHRQKPLPEA